MNEERSTRTDERHPRFECPRLPDAVPADDLDAVAAALAAVTAVPMRQAWRSAPEPALRPAAVKTGWQSDALLVYAELEDADIFNPVTEFNAPAFRHGDVFEIFVQPAGQAAYYEFHVTPANVLFQLRFPAPGAARAEKGLRPEWYVTTPIASRVEVQSTAQRWRVLARVPFALVEARASADPAARRWHASFCRYDYTRGAAAPVLSSTSPHAALDFHRVYEWGTIAFR